MPGRRLGSWDVSGRESRHSSLERSLPIGDPGDRTSQSNDMLTRPRCDSAGGWLSQEVKMSVKVEVSSSDAWGKWLLRPQFPGKFSALLQLPRESALAAQNYLGHF